MQISDRVKRDVRPLALVIVRHLCRRKIESRAKQPFLLEYGSAAAFKRAIYPAAALILVAYSVAKKMKEVIE
jgi:hypothetical protein